MKYSEHLAADRRRMILELLAEGQGHGSEKVLYAGLLALGEYLEVTPDYVREQLVALKAFDCITTEIIRDTIMVAHMTPRGAAVLRGGVKIDGVTQPPLGG